MASPRFPTRVLFVFPTYSTAEYAFNLFLYLHFYLYLEDDFRMLLPSVYGTLKKVLKDRPMRNLKNRNKYALMKYVRKFEFEEGII